MSLFISPRDVEFFLGLNRELVDQIIETSVVIYSFNAERNNTNIYGESVEKIFEPGVLVNALITHEDETTEDDQFGPNVNQTITCAFRRPSLKEIDFYPERGDVIKYNNAYYEIFGVVDNQLLAGRESIPWSILCQAIMTNRSSINIRGEA